MLFRPTWRLRCDGTCRRALAACERRKPYLTKYVRLRFTGPVPTTELPLLTVSLPHA